MSDAQTWIKPGPCPICGTGETDLAKYSACDGCATRLPMALFWALETEGEYSVGMPGQVFRFTRAEGLQSEYIRLLGVAPSGGSIDVRIGAILWAGKGPKKQARS